MAVSRSSRWAASWARFLYVEYFSISPGCFNPSFSSPEETAWEKRETEVTPHPYSFSKQSTGYLVSRPDTAWDSPVHLTWKIKVLQTFWADLTVPIIQKKRPNHQEELHTNLVVKKDKGLLSIPAAVSQVLSVAGNVYQCRQTSPVSPPTQGQVWRGFLGWAGRT